LTIELTPAQGAESLRSRTELTWFSASEDRLMRSRAQSRSLLKTLFLLEHLPKSRTCSGSLRIGFRLNCLCSALYSSRLESYSRSSAPRGGLLPSPNVLPNLFRCQTSMAFIACKAEP